MGRIIAIGDIHGCSEELKLLLEKLELQSDDHLVFLGDLVNRGPDSRGVLDIIHGIAVKKTLILGNHELRLLNYRSDPANTKLKDYDEPTLAVLKPRDWDLLGSMIPMLYVEEYETVFVHGGFEPRKPWRSQSAEVVSNVQAIDLEGHWKRRSKAPELPMWSTMWIGPPFVVYGHTPHPEIVRTTWTLCLDTACVLGGSLSAYLLPSKEIVQVAAKKAYIEKSS